MLTNANSATYRKVGPLIAGLVVLLFVAYMLGWMATDDKLGLMSVVLVLGFLGAFFLLRHPNVGFALLFFMIPLGSVTRLGGGKSIVFLLAILLMGMFVSRVLTAHEKIKFDRVALLGCALAGLAMLSSVWAHDPKAALLKAILRLSQMVALYILVLNYCRTERQLNTVTLSFIAGSMVGALVTMITGTTFGGSDRITLDQEFNTNSFARLMGLSIILVFYYIYKLKPKLIRLVFVIGILAMAYVIIGSQSRSVWIAFPASFLLTAFLLHRNSKVVNYSLKIIVIIAVALSFAYFSGIISESVTKRFESLYYVFSEDPETGTTSTGRFDIWKVGMVMIRETMPLGVGFENYKRVYKNYGAETDPSEYTWARTRARGAHNTYLAILAELGIAGFALLMGILAYVGKSIMWIADPIGRFIYMWLFIFLLIAILTGVYHIVPWFWFMLFLLSCQGKLNREYYLQRVPLQSSI